MISSTPLVQSTHLEAWVSSSVKHPLVFLPLKYAGASSALGPQPTRASTSCLYVIHSKPTPLLLKLVCCHRPVFCFSRLLTETMEQFYPVLFQMRSVGQNPRIHPFQTITTPPWRHQVLFKIMTKLNLREKYTFT